MQRGVAIIHDASPGLVPRLAAKLKCLAGAAAVVIYAACLDTAVIFASLAEGACGCVAESAPPDQLRQAISEAGRGRVFLCNLAEWEVRERLKELAAAAGSKPLTEKEAQVCLWLVGHQEKVLPFLLSLRTSTVHTHVERVYAKLGAHSREQFLGLLCRRR